MGTSSIEAEFNVCWSKLTPVEKESLLIVARNYVQLKEDKYNITVKQYNEEIDEAMLSMDKGESFEHEQVVKLSENWLHGK